MGKVIELEPGRPPAFSDEALALRFAERHQHSLRYVAAWGKWLVWDGKRWLFDDTLRAFDFVRKMCRQASAECKDPKVALLLASARTIAAVERLAKSDRHLAATVDQWDADPWLLNTPNGIIDLRTGERRECNPTAFMTKITAVAPGGGCPNWHQFLNRIFAADENLKRL
jgi:putative DNA primase/helicase